MKEQKEIEKLIEKLIEVGDRVTYECVVSKLIYDNGFTRSEKVKEKNIMIKIASNVKYTESAEIIKVERIGKDGWYTVYKKSAEILDKIEKEYLKSVIKPFKSRIEYIKKVRKYYSNLEYICIVLKENNIGILPDFKPGTMYKNMKLETEYTLSELGL